MSEKMIFVLDTIKWELMKCQVSPLVVMATYSQLLIDSTTAAHPVLKAL